MQIKNLIDHLGSELELFKELVSTLHKETECIVSRDYKGLYETVGTKDHLVMRIKAASEARLLLIKAALASLGAAPESEENLSSVILVARGSSGAIEECQRRLVSLASTIQEINGLNSALTESSMSNVAKTLAFLGNFMQPSTYKSTGSFDGFAVKGSRLSEGA